MKYIGSFGRRDDMRSLALAFGIVLLAGLALAAIPAGGSHWCDETLVTVGPSFVASGSSQKFAITLRNQGANDTQLTTVEVAFEWETAPHVLNGGPLVAGGSIAYNVTSSAVPQGFHLVTVTFNGTNAADLPGEVTSCTGTRTIATIGATQDILGGIVDLLLMVLTIVIISVVIIVSLVFLLSRKRKTPPLQQPPPTGTSEGVTQEPSVEPPPSNP